MTALATGAGNFAAFFPSEYVRQEPRVRTGELVVQRGIRSRLPLLLWRIESARTRLRATSAITVHVRSENDFVFAENESLAIFAHGRTADEALEDFQEHVAHFFEYYSRLRTDQVIGDAIRLKELFAGLFVKE